MARLTTIVTGLPPAVDGVGDYAWYLAQQLQKDFNLSSSFVVGNPSWQAGPATQEIEVAVVQRRSPKALVQHLENTETVLLHYVGYGYARRGSPVWLLDGLKQWRRKYPQGQLVTMFHEIAAYMPNPLSSQFWTAPLQRYLAQQLIQLSDQCLTSKQSYAERIIHLSGGKHLQVPSLPVFSNIGEPPLDQLLPLSERPPRLVVFGGGGTRGRVYQKSLDLLTHTCKQLQITEILDIGPSITGIPKTLANVPIRCLGVKEAPEVSQWLQQARVGFFDYSLPFLGKSTVFAAYCAHRVLPVGVFYPGIGEDGLAPGEQYLLANQPLPNSLAFQKMADNAHKWYISHNLKQQAQLFYRAIFGN